MTPRIAILLVEIEHLHRRFIDADAEASSALDELLFSEELEAVSALARLRADFLSLQAASVATATPYFDAIRELLVALEVAEHAHLAFDFS